MRGQDGYFANNEALIYEFQGFTDDGRTYILATIPLAAPILLSTYDPAENSNPDAIPVPSDLPSDYVALAEVIYDYNQTVRLHLEELAAADFSPGLDLLDQLVASLIVEGSLAGGLRDVESVLAQSARLSAISGRLPQDSD